MKKTLPFVLLAAVACSNNPSADGIELSPEALAINTNATYTMASVPSGKCVGIAGSSTANSASAELRTCNGSASQKFRIQVSTTGYYKITNTNSGKCLDVNAKSTADNAKIIQYTCNGGTNQQWAIADTTGGAVRLTARNSGKVMGPSQGASSDGTILVQTTWRNAAYQSFLLSTGSPGTGGTIGTGGTSATGGTTPTGGTSSAGGTTSTGGTVEVGGSVGTGGAVGTGGSVDTGGSTGTGGAAGAGGSTPAGRVRSITSFDQGWLFRYGDVTGASAISFADSAWRQLSVPHDWSIEGSNPPANPFSSTAATSGRGGYLPSGIAWYRKHFTLPQGLGADKVFIEFDGVMANASVYVNGTLVGTHPYGYVSFRYDITANVKLTGDNVIAVKTDTTSQPASRYYAGAGIYRHVRLITTDPVRIDQWATFVTTPSPTATSATVHVQTTVVNGGTATASVSVQGIVSDPNGVALAPVTTAAKGIAAGASASFTFDVPVTNPALWDLKTPNLYQLRTNVQVGGVTVDDDVTPFGIRSVTFDAATGMSLNGKSLKFQGVCLHQDFHGLGMAAPQRAMQRRLAQLKALGVNAIRTSHDSPSPELLELTDKMGFLVLDEFFDVWTAHKYTDVGDYATYFNKTASIPTGMPAVPGVATGALWYQVDMTGTIMRDRNHPSVVMYSMGNEIRDSLATRTPILTKMVAISHTLDPTRPVTQALFRPQSSGDVTGATRTLLDVFGGNYRPAEVLTAMAMSPARAGVLTEVALATSEWADVANNPALTGLFIWTGADYLGEANASWPIMGATYGLMDAVGTVKQVGYDWQAVWGVPPSGPPATGTTAAKVVVAADHSTLVADFGDIVFVKATIADASGNVVTSASNPVTFAITGPGTIVAVDSGSQTQESFRGRVRNAYRGIAYALVQATGAGTITVTATSGTLTGDSATVTATAGTFLPCSGTCD